MTNATGNGYIRGSWPRAEVVGGVQLLKDWWSRPYEYAWAAQFIVPGRPVADVGSGPYQPFVDELAQRGCRVTAIDNDPAACETIAARWAGKPWAAGSGVLCAAGETLDYAGFDAVFCISTIEHVADWHALMAALCTAPLVVLTFDVSIVPLLDPWTIPDLIASEAEGHHMRAVGELDFGVPADVVEWNSALRAFCLAVAR